MAGSRRQKHPDLIERYVGSRIRLRRRMLGITQRGLGSSLGVSPQQVQKYETGMSCVCAGRLYQIACALKAPVSSFFPQPGEGGVAEGGECSGAAIEWLSSSDAVELNLAAMQLADPEFRRNLIKLVRSMAASSGEGVPPG